MSGSSSSGGGGVKRRSVVHSRGFGHAVKRLVPGSKSSVGSEVVKGLGGCKVCPFLGTSECPFYPVVDRGSPHVDGSCWKFHGLVKLVGSERNLGLLKQKQMLLLLRDEVVLDRLYGKYMSGLETGEDEGKLKGKSLELLEWSKHVGSSLHKIRVHEEGSKVKVERSMTPSDVLKALRSAEGLIEVEAETVQEKEEEVEDDDGVVDDANDVDDVSKVKGGLS